MVGSGLGTASLFLLFSCALTQQAAKQEKNDSKFAKPRILILGPGGAGKSGLALSLIGAKNVRGQRNSDGRKCFELCPEDSNCFLSKSYTEDICAKEDYFLGDNSSRKITVIDTPGFGFQDFIEEETLDKIVKYLTEDMLAVNTFAIVLPHDTNRQTAELNRFVYLMKGTFAGNFGKSFAQNIILVASKWRYDRKGEAEEAAWLKVQKNLFRTVDPSGAENLRAIYFNAFFNVSNKTEADKYYSEMHKLLDWSTENACFSVRGIRAEKTYSRRLEEKLKILEEELEIARNLTVTSIPPSASPSSPPPVTGSGSLAGAAVGCLLLGVLLGAAGFYYFKTNCDGTDPEEEEDKELDRVQSNNANNYHTNA